VSSFRPTSRPEPRTLRAFTFEVNGPSHWHRPNPVEFDQIRAEFQRFQQTSFCV
jgi:hypothetical protein